MTRPRCWLPLAAALTMATAGCSPFMTRPPRSQPATSAPRCDPASPAPVADLIGAGASGGLAGFSLVQGLRCDEACLAFFIALPAALVAAIYSGSSIYGYRTRARCRAAVRAYTDQARPAP